MSGSSGYRAYLTYVEMNCRPARTQRRNRLEVIYRPSNRRIYMKAIHVDETLHEISCPIEKRISRVESSIYTLSSYLLYFPL